MNCMGTMRIYGELLHNDSNTKASMTLWTQTRFRTEKRTFKALKVKLKKYTYPYRTVIWKYTHCELQNDTYFSM